MAFGLFEESSAGTLKAAAAAAALFTFGVKQGGKANGGGLLGKRLGKMLEGNEK